MYVFVNPRNHVLPFAAFRCLLFPHVGVMFSFVFALLAACCFRCVTLLLVYIVYTACNICIAFPLPYHVTLCHVVSLCVVLCQADVGLAATIGAMDAANAVAVEWGLGASTPGVLEEVTKIVN